MSFNKVILMGNLTRDPDYRVTANGHQICKLGIAVNRRYTTQSGEQRDETTFVDVDSFGRQAETISKFFSKGRAILIEGRLRMDEWENQQGERRSKLLVHLETFSFVNDGQGGGGGAASQGGNAPARQPQSQSDTPAPQNATSGDDEDVPF
ncbi:MAG: single-stranded DNA-binding protein [Opitutae bacterium]|jgi:single-strand DNA-binding protein|nr:single-stranded DNA-binding protein [Opitutae bacterium]MBT4224031.1 single-stranded DNA-binding protein [Opitutae bacterium]MBT5380399.1 single-stranded DNA-binding protein [Opitutae bacterium]MBT5693057.1 single-stranded DNA-binding protein [Opitutae bacterium]MBT6463493.1 single-stranded DNA-binding protein [Opitutae bacterium]